MFTRVPLRCSDGGKTCRSLQSSLVGRRDGYETRSTIVLFGYKQSQPAETIRSPDQKWLRGALKDLGTSWRRDADQTRAQCMNPSIVRHHKHVRRCSEECQVGEKAKASRTASHIIYLI